MALRFTWARTWPEDHRSQRDYIVRDPGGRPGSMRIFPYAATGEQGVWYWTVSDSHQLAKGLANSKMGAAGAAEAAWLAKHPGKEDMPG